MAASWLNLFPFFIKEFRKLKNSTARLIFEDIENIEAQVHTKEKALSSMRHTESKATTGVFDIQKKYQSLQKELNFISSKKNQIDVDLARTETRKDDIAEEINKDISLI